MATIAIDTHKTIKKLVEMGFTIEQAEGMVSALTEGDIVVKNQIIRW